MFSKDDILKSLLRLGPCIPVQIKKELKEGDTFIIGALLTELKAIGKIRISNTKRGGSPYYYLPEHANRLVNIMSDLAEKDLRTANLLKEKLILQDSKQDPLTRVSLRNIKDFAVRIDVNLNNEKVLFWKWFLLSNERTKELIKNSLGIKNNPIKTKNTKESEAVANLNEKISKTTDGIKKPDVLVSPPSSINSNSSNFRSASHSDHHNKDGEINVAGQNADKQNVLGENFVSRNVFNQDKQTLLNREVKDKKSTIHNDSLVSSQGVKSEMFNLEDYYHDSFAKKIINYLLQKQISIESVNIIRKNSDIEFLLKIPSPIGLVDYFCKAKSKKKSNDGDLSNVFLQAQLKKLPALFLTTGVITKKAKEKLDREFKGLKVLEI